MHPTQKPDDLIKTMLSWYDFETVFDPYMGSGTTGLAAKALNKHFIGFEIDEAMWRAACENIETGRVDKTYKTAMDGPLFHQGE